MCLKIGFIFLLAFEAFEAGDKLALLSGTLKNFNKFACDEEWMSLRCPAGTTISTETATYGNSPPATSACLPATHPQLLEENKNASCDWPPALQYSLLQTVVGLCQKKTSCKFTSSPRTFGGGDPCPGIRKLVTVVYKCRPSEFRSGVVCENETLELKCNASKRVAIYEGVWGRAEYEGVRCPQPKGVHEESCTGTRTTETVMELCHGKRRCTLKPRTDNFGNPCRLQSRHYLKVIYTCVPRRVLLDTYQSEPEPDEIFDDEHDEEISDAVAGVIEQPSIYSPDHSKGWVNPKTTGKPRLTHKEQFENSEKFYLYVTICVASGLLLIVVLILIKIVVQQRRTPTAVPSEDSVGLELGIENAGATVTELSKPTSSISNLTSIAEELDDLPPLPSNLLRRDELKVCNNILCKKLDEQRRQAELRVPTENPTFFYS